MDDDQVSISSNVSTVADLSTYLQNAIKAKGAKVTSGNTTGVFLSTRTVAKLEMMVQNLNSQPQNEADNEVLLNLNEQINDLRSTNASLLKANNDLVSNLKGSIEKAKTVKADYDKLVKFADAETADQNSKIEELKKTLKDVRSEHSAKKADWEKLRHGFDEQAALAAQSKYTDSSDQITSLNNELQALNNSVASLRKEKADALAKVKAQEALIQSEKDAASSLSEKLNAISKGYEVKPKATEFNKGLAVKLIGDKGLKYLVECERLNREQVRDQCYNLLLSVKSGNNKTLQGLKGLLELVLAWIKRQKHHARRRVQNWLDLIEGDLKSGKLKTLKFYREALESVLEHIKTVPTQAKKAYEGAKEYIPKPTFIEKLFDTMWIYSYIVFNRVRNLFSFRKKKVDKGKSPEKSPYIKLFDAEEAGPSQHT